MINPFELLETYGLDPVRYFLLREVPFGHDGDFSKTSLKNRLNGELADSLGNFCQRILSFIQKNLDGKSPRKGTLSEESKEFLESIHGLLPDVEKHLHTCSFHLALETIFQRIRLANVYVDQMAPWKLKKENPHQMESTLWVCVEAIRLFGLILQPFMPQTAVSILSQLGMEESEEGFSFEQWSSSLPEGVPLPSPIPFLKSTQKTKGRSKCLLIATVT